MKKKIDQIELWRLDAGDAVYIVFTDYSKLNNEEQSKARAFADFEGKEIADYFFFAFVHVVNNNIVIPENDQKNGMNIAMCQKRYINVMWNNHNISMKKMYPIGYLKRLQVFHIVTSLAGLNGLAKNGFFGNKKSKFSTLQGKSITSDI